MFYLDITKNNTALKKIMLTIIGVFSLITHTAENVNQEKQDFYELTFADGSTKKCPAPIIEQFSMIQHANMVLPKDYALDLSRSPLTKTQVGALVVIMQHPSSAPDLLSDAPLLSAITTADYLLEPQHPTCEELLNNLVARVRRQTKEERTAFYEQFTNRHAILYREHILKNAPADSTYQPIYSILRYAHGSISSENEFPVASRTTKPVVGPFPLSVQDLRDADLMPTIEDISNAENTLDFSHHGLTSLVGLEALQFPTVDYLNFLNNQITSANPGIFNGFTNLRRLNLRFNNIPFSCCLQILNIATLRECYLIENPITSDEQELLRTAFPAITFFFHSWEGEEWIEAEWPDDLP